MLKLGTLWALTVYFLLPINATSAETVKEGGGETLATVTDPLEQYAGAAGRIQELLNKYDGNFPLKESLNLVNELLFNKSEDQDLIYKFVRTMNRNLDRFYCKNIEKCEKLVDEIRDINRELLNTSYSDMLHQNANLSNQLRTRLANLIADSVDIADSLEKPELTKEHQDDFQQEYKLISQRFLNSSRFRIGVGAYNTFLPRIIYKGDHRIDFTPYTSTVIGGADRLLFNTEFTNEYSANFILSARIPYVEISATFPSFRKQNNTISPVKYRNVEESDFDLLSRSSINSTLVFDYEVGANISIKDIAYKLFDLDEITTQVDFGLGIGAAGIKVTDVISTEIKIATADSNLFADLTQNDVIESGQTKSYVLPFVSIFYTFEVSDEIQISVDFKQYLHPGGRDITETNDLNLSIKAVWFPTYNWFKKPDKNGDDEKKSTKS